ncbi:hypothetical protein BTZ20_0462 [Rhodococcus sp. MTM3W5.2]|nr:hypothetical protein BTZ20_0462 [Rhodococcus sp. MTM3W5.2]
MPDEQPVGPPSDRQRERARQDPVLLGVAEHQRRQQREREHRTQRDLHRVLPRLGAREPFRPSEIRTRECERDHCDGRHQHAPPRQPVHRAVDQQREFGQHHARREPRQVSGQPVVGVDRVRRRHRHEHPAEAERRHAEQHRDPQARGRAAQADERQRDQREQRVERHLHRQAPHLGQPAGQRQRHEHLGKAQIRQPHLQPAARLREEQQDQHDRHPVGGQDAGGTVQQVPPDRRGRAQSAGRRRVRAPQQEPGQREEQRHRHVESAPDAAEHRITRRPCLEGDVGDQHTERGESPHALQRGMNPRGADTTCCGWEASVLICRPVCPSLGVSEEDTRMP